MATPLRKDEKTIAQFDPTHATVLDRILDRIVAYVRTPMPWQRRLRHPGTVLALRELAGCVAVEGENIISSGALSYAQNRMLEQINADLAVGRVSRGRLQTLLSARLLKEHAAELQALADEVESGYLLGWSQALTDPAQTIGPPKAVPASLVSAHLLDLGFAAQHLYGWFKSKDRDHALPDVLESAHHALAATPPRDFDVMISFVSCPELGSKPASWVEPSAVEAWLKVHKFTSAHRSAGGLLLQFDARDEQHAVALAAEVVDRLTARVRAALSSDLIAHSHAWTSQWPEPLPLHRARRLGVTAMGDGRILDVTTVEVLDNALQFAAALERGPVARGAEGGWAALEVLLAAPDKEKVSAAKHAADPGDLVGAS